MHLAHIKNTGQDDDVKNINAAPDNEFANDALDTLKELPYIPISEIRKHNKPWDCWMLIHGRVYDIGPILSTHPGGSRILLKYAGMDATYQFDDVGHTVESLIYGMPQDSLKGYLLDEAKEGSKGRQDQLGQEQEIIDEKQHLTQDDECVLIAQNQSQNGYQIWHRLYTLLLYITIIICVSLLLYLRLFWGDSHKVLDTAIIPGANNVTIHHMDQSSAASPSYPEYDKIPAWAY